MTNLLTFKEYQSIAKNINFPSNQFINGGFKKPFGKQVINNINPSSKKILNKIQEFLKKYKKINNFLRKIKKIKEILKNIQEFVKKI